MNKDSLTVSKSAFSKKAGHVEIPAGTFFIKLLMEGKLHKAEVSFQPDGQSVPTHTAETESFAKLGEVLDDLHGLLPVPEYEVISHHLKSGIKTAHVGANPEPLAVLQQKVLKENALINEGARGRHHH